MNSDKLRILLIKASYTSPLQEGIVHPLGIMTLASILKNNGYLVELLDMRITKKNLNDVLESFKPDIVGISALTTEAKSMHAIALSIKSQRKNITVIVGGPHPTAFPVEVLKDNNIDFIVLGEGEKPLLHLLSSLNAGTVDKVKGVGYRQNGNYVYSFPENFIENLDELPLPAWELIEFEEYSKYKAESNFPPRRYASLFTSRGCPYRCIYCHNMFGKKFRAMSPEKVVGEIEFLVNKYMVREFEVLDDIFNLDRTRMRRICELIINKNLKIKLLFPNGLRTDLLDEETLRLLKDAGTTYISFAIETASLRLQRFIKKNLNIERVKKNIEVAEKIGIITHGFFMFGFPTETEMEARETLNFAIKSKLTTASFFIVTPFKNTELWTMVEKKLKTKDNYFEYFEYFRAPFNLSEMNNNILLKIYRSAYRRFYLSIPRIIKILKNYRITFHSLRYLLYLLRRMLSYKNTNPLSLTSLEQ